jgi:hypothetical protein
MWVLREVKENFLAHHYTMSQTTGVEVCHSPGSSYTFLDFGGFKDTRGSEVEIEIAVSTKLVLEKTSQLIFIICFDYSLLELSRSQYFTEQLKFVFEHFFSKYYKEFPASFLVLLTKPPLLDDGTSSRTAVTRDSFPIAIVLKNGSLLIDKFFFHSQSFTPEFFYFLA